MTASPALNSHDLRTPEIFPLLLDAAHDRAGLIRLDEAAYTAASFLDERIASDGVNEWAPWIEVERAATGLPIDLDFIFHIGHVGSTLVSRLLGSNARIFSLREPAALRTLARIEVELRAETGPWNREIFEKRLDILLGLWSRTFQPGQRSLLKATSFVGEMASVLLDRSSGARAILMFVSPRTYMATILGGPASLAELPKVSGARLERLRLRIGGHGWEVEDLSSGEMAAMGWVSELLGLAEAADQFGDRVWWLDFEDFLAHPDLGLTDALRNLYGAASASEVGAMLLSPDFSRYSKAPEHPYDAGLRRRVLAEAASTHAQEIDRGVAWLNAAAQRHPMILQAATMAAKAPKLG